MFVRSLIRQKSLQTIAVNLSRQKELNGDSKAIQQIEFIEKLKKDDGENAECTKVMFGLTILEKNQRNETKIFSSKPSGFTKDSEL